MKKIIVVALATLSLMCYGKAAKRMEITEKFISALIQVESNGDSTKIGKAGEVGCLQIRQCVIDDVNRIYKTSYVLNDAKNDDKAKDICRKYLKHWGSHYERKTGKIADNKVLSKIWNGGPNGPWKQTTYVLAQLNKYWSKVEGVLNSLA